MTRQQLLIKLLRHYGIRYVMVEGNYITKEEYFDELIQVMENEGILKLEESQDATTK